MGISAGHYLVNHRAAGEIVDAALATRSAMWPETVTDLGALEPGWISAEALFADAAAVEEYLAYEGSFYQRVDRRTSAAAMMVDYSYIFAMATVPLLAGFGIVPDLSPRNYALQFHLAPLEHDGQTLDVRRAHIRFLSTTFRTNREVRMDAAHQPVESTDICDLYRQAVEDHMRPLVETLSDRTGLSRSALWRLVADAIAAGFLDAGRRFDRLEEAQAMAMKILKQPGSPLCNRQLHFFELTLRDDEQRKLLSWTFRARGGCCRYYTVEEGKLCHTCVLKKREDRNAGLLRTMRRMYRATADGGKIPC